MLLYLNPLLVHKDNTEDPIFLIEGPQPNHDLSYPFTERNEDLSYIQKGVKLKSFRDNINKRNLECEFKVNKSEISVYLTVSSFLEDLLKIKCIRTNSAIIIPKLSD